jgi:Fe2+ or Zn2+ uptake regulation protein
VQRHAKPILTNYLAQRGLRITRHRTRHCLSRFKLFAETGIAREIRLDDGLACYEVVTGTERHDHLVCTKCGAVTGRNGALEMLHKEAGMNSGFRIDQVRGELQGYAKGVWLDVSSEKS